MKLYVTRLVLGVPEEAHVRTARWIGEHRMTTHAVSRQTFYIDVAQVKRRHAARGAVKYPTWSTAKIVTKPTSRRHHHLMLSNTCYLNQKES